MKKYSEKLQKGKSNSIIRKIKENSIDKSKAKSLIEELLALQQKRVIPTEIYVPVTDVIATYDFGSFSLIKCKTCIIFKTTGYRLISKPIYTANEDGGVLYSQLSALCEMKERYDSVSDEEKKLWNLVFNLSVIILSLPIDAFSNDKFLFEVGKFIAEKKNEMYEEPLKKPLQEETEEDEIANDKFRQEVESEIETDKEESNA